MIDKVELSRENVRATAQLSSTMVLCNRSKGTLDAIGLRHPLLNGKDDTQNKEDVNGGNILEFP